jgi:hypothetical protein
MGVSPRFSKISVSRKAAGSEVQGVLLRARSARTSERTSAAAPSGLDETITARTISLIWIPMWGFIPSLGSELTECLACENTRAVNSD